MRIFHLGNHLGSCHEEKQSTDRLLMQRTWKLITGLDWQHCTLPLRSLNWSGLKKNGGLCNLVILRGAIHQYDFFSVDGDLMLVSKTEETLDQDVFFSVGGYPLQHARNLENHQRFWPGAVHSHHQRRKHQTEDDCIYNCQKELKMLSWSWILRPAPHGGNI